MVSTSSLDNPAVHLVPGPWLRSWSSKKLRDWKPKKMQCSRKKLVDRLPCCQNTRCLYWLSNYSSRCMVHIPTRWVHILDINIEMHRTCFDMHVLAQQEIVCTPKSSHAPDSNPYWSSTCHTLSVDQHGTEKRKKVDHSRANVNWQERNMVWIQWGWHCRVTLIASGTWHLPVIGLLETGIYIYIIQLAMLTTSEREPCYGSLITCHAGAYMVE